MKSPRPKKRKQKSELQLESFRYNKKVYDISTKAIDDWDLGIKWKRK